MIVPILRRLHPYKDVQQITATRPLGIVAAWPTTRDKVQPAAQDHTKSLQRFIATLAARSPNHPSAHPSQSIYSRGRSSSAPAPSATTVVCAPPSLHMEHEDHHPEDDRVAWPSFSPAYTTQPYPPCFSSTLAAKHVLHPLDAAPCSLPPQPSRRPTSTKT